MKEILKTIYTNAEVNSESFFYEAELELDDSGKIVYVNALWDSDTEEMTFQVVKESLIELSKEIMNHPEQKEKLRQKRESICEEDITEYLACDPEQRYADEIFSVQTMLHDRLLQDGVINEDDEEIIFP